MADTHRHTATPGDDPATLQATLDRTGQAQQAGGYTPVFGERTRTVVYVLALVASVIGLGLMAFGHPDIGGFISTAAGIIAAGFGVTYNPIRLSGK